VKKRGLQIDITSILILAIILLVLFSPWIIETLLDFQAKTPKDICKASVLSNAVLRIGKLEFVSAVQCYTQDYEISERDKEEVKKELATHFTDCADQFLQGKRELFSDDAVFCHVCSTISFEQKGKTITGFKKYLFETHMPKTEGTYAQFLAGYESPGAAALGIQQTSFLQEDTLDTSKTYAPVFVYVRGKDKIQQYATTAGSVSLIVLGLGIAAKGGIITATTFWTVKGAVVGLLTTTVGLTIAGVGALIEIFGGPDTEWMAVTQFMEYSPEALKSLGCEKKVPVEKRG